MKKYDIHDFYVGKLVYLLKFANVLATPSLPETKNKRLEIFESIKKGAIKLNYGFIMHEYTDWINKIDYESIFTCFYKKRDNYYCLHNGNEYHMINNGNDYCEQLIPLVDCLPKIGCNVNYELSFKEVLKLFDILFKRSVKKIYNDETVDINNIFLGNLNICTSYSIDTEKEQKFCFQNIPEDKIISSQKNLYSMSGHTEREIKDNSIIEYDIDKYKCIFLLMSNGNYYNLNSFKLYKVNNGEINYKIEINSNLVDILDKYNINIKEKEITIPKVLKLQQKILVR